MERKSATGAGRGLGKRFNEYHGPTAVLAVAVYAGWGALVFGHDTLPAYLFFPMAAYLTALHTSLQHESIHALYNWPRWLRNLIAFPPLGLVYPYPLYKRLHKTHHRDARLTDPIDDPESFYVTPERWQRVGALGRALLLAHQTLAGRMILGPVLAVFGLVATEVPKLLRLDGEAVRTWGVHALLVAALFTAVEAAGLAWWAYVLCFAWPGLMLTLLRSFAEHRSADEPQARTAIVESGSFFGLLYLFNNLHVVHHRDPAMPWYEIPTFYRENRDRLAAENGGFVYAGYGELIRRHLFKPVFHPVHPAY